MAKQIIPDLVLDDVLVAANPRLENPRAEAELKALRDLLAPACDKVIGAYAEIANHKSAERAFKRFLQNMISAT
ncbi:TPA: hypothetical protein ROH55_001870 [Pseudomonas aeruginosa]|nr:hypothetical protein [Pseudomonas aeruginosa]MCO2858301.1 hypothetical protein [Pseudomonas aeruginosa]HBO2924796.1 hypothetical protein [Pseudomonas aeruginosa]HBO3607237.1 hypothetical protein [Pseudomonas aeruginosa]HBP1485163.1 hypothetical protein [Pseudomonas aeruginosa]